MLQDIIDNSCKEKEIQIYLQEHPYILSNIIGGYNEILPKFKLGSEYECDFLSFTKYSMRMEITIFELKLPNAKLLTTANIPTKDLSLAISQVSKYMNWAKDNETYFRKQLFKRYAPNNKAYEQFYPLFEYHSVIIIGQRSQFSENENSYRKDFYRTSNGSIEIIPYDRLIESENNNIYTQ
ncbi:MAG: DUF4263 domain-containing protein [Acetatifactor sp.]|nr:DUF4263 domain-containing protein [Acetatifactor sp.]